MTEATDAAAIIAAIRAKLPAGKSAFELSDPAVKNLTTDHVLVITSRRYVDERLGSGEVPLPGGRVLTRYVALTAGNLRLLRAATTAALEDQILTGDVGPFTFEVSDPPDDDDGWITGADTWTY